MEVAPNQVGELYKEWVNEGAREVSQNNSLLLREREVYSLGDAIREKNEATVPGVVRSNDLRCSRTLTIEGSYLRERCRIASSMKGQRVPV
jgi:hypothetical protein